MRVRAILVVGAFTLGAASSAAGSERQDLLLKLLLDAPADVEELALRAIDCRTWSMADVTDEASDARVQNALAALRCDMLAAEVDALRRKHGGSGPELKAIDAVRDLCPWRGTRRAYPPHGHRRSIVHAGTEIEIRPQREMADLR